MKLDKSDKRADIFRAALEVFAENGFHGSPTSLIAARAEVGTGTIYRYFQSKDDLIRELHRELHEKLIQAVFSGYSESLPIRQRFFHIFANLMRHLLLFPTDFRFLEQFYNSPFGIAHRRDRLENPQQVDTYFDNLFEEGKSKKIFKDLPDDLLCSLTSGPISFITRDHIAGFLEIDEALIEKTVNACWDAVSLGR